MGTHRPIGIGKDGTGPPSLKNAEAVPWTVAKPTDGPINDVNVCLLATNTMCTDGLGVLTGKLLAFLSAYKC